MTSTVKWPPGLAALILCTALVSGCGDDEPDGTCLASVDPAFILDIRDSVTNEGRAVPSVATVVDGAFSDTLPLTGVEENDSWRVGPTERGGTYDLTVAAPGYQTWSRENVTVHSGHCGVGTVYLEVRLQQE